MRFAEGEARNYSESATSFELAFVSGAGESARRIVAIPDTSLASGDILRRDDLPLTVRVKSYWPNSLPSWRPPARRGDPPRDVGGVARYFDFAQEPETRNPDFRNVPTAVIELEAAGRSLGTWVASAWAGDETLAPAARKLFAREVGPETAPEVAARLLEPQTVEAAGKTWSLALRPARRYESFSLTLLKTAHAEYRGTSIPKDFRSRVRIDNPETGERREVDIFMNNPLRYRGLTFYQYQMGTDELDPRRGTSTLEVVRNPSWLTPYAGCGIVGLGMVVQFMMHLAGFVARRRSA